MKVYLTILVFVVKISSFAQIRAENVQNKKDMVKYLDVYYFKGSRNDTSINYYKSTVFRGKWNDPEVVKYFDKANKNHFIKLDLNKDGKTDIVWNGCFNESAKVIAFISSGNTYKVEPVSLNYEDYTFHIILPYDKQRFVLCRIDREKIDTAMHYQFADRFMYDTIEYDKEVFVASNLKGLRYNLDTFYCKLFGIYIKSNDKITICKSGMVYLDKDIYIRDTARRKYYYKKLDKDSIDQFFSLAEKLPFYSFKEFYSPVGRGPRDGHRFRAEFVFADRRSQKVSDYLSMGPFGLRYLFSWVMKLRKDDNWILNSEAAE